VKDRIIYGVTINELNGVAEVVRQVVAEKWNMPIDFLPTVMIDPRESAEAIREGLSPAKVVGVTYTTGEMGEVLGFTLLPEDVRIRTKGWLAEWNKPKKKAKLAEKLGGEELIPGFTAHCVISLMTLAYLQVPEEDWEVFREDAFRRVGKYKGSEVKRYD
jgi:hypothetical protein